MPKSHAQIYLVFWLCIFCILNLSVRDLVAYSSYANPAWLPIVCSALGAILAEAFILAALVAFGPQRIMNRVFWSWGLGLVLFGCLVLGAVNCALRRYSSEVLPQFLSQLGFLYVHVSIAIAAMAVALILVRRESHLRLVEQNGSLSDDGTGRTQWTLLDLMTVTLLCSLSFALYRFIPIQLQNVESSAVLVFLVIGVAVTSTITPIVAGISVSLLVQVQRAIDEATTNSSRLQPFLVCLGAQGLLVLTTMVPAQLSYSTILLALLLSLVAIFGAFATTIIAALTFANFAGWRLRGRRQNSTTPGA